MTRHEPPDDDMALTRFIRHHEPRIPMPPPGHVARVSAAMRVAAHRARIRALLEAGAVAAVVAASVALYLTHGKPPLRDVEPPRDAERILVESFEGMSAGTLEMDDPGYEAWTP